VTRETERTIIGWIKLAAAAALLVMAGYSVAHGQSNQYSSWSNFPQSQSFFPIAVWRQSTSYSFGSGSPPYSSLVPALQGTKINILLQPDNAIPTTFGVDPSGTFQTFINGGIYFVPLVDVPVVLTFTNGSAVIAGTNDYIAGGTVKLSTTGTLPTNFATGTTYFVLSTGLSGSQFELSLTSGGAAISAGSAGSGTQMSSTNTSPTSVASFQAIASGDSGSQYLIGYNLGDEPAYPSPMSQLPSLIPLATAYDTTRPFFWNFTDWPFGHGGCFPPSCSTNTAALQAISVGSQDVYPVISTFNGNSNIPLITGTVNTSATAGTNGCSAGTYSVTNASGSAFPSWFLAAGQQIVIGTAAPFTLASDVSSTVVCATTNPTLQTGATYNLAQDSMWIQGASVAALVTAGTLNQPIWAFVDTGSNALGLSGTSPTCNQVSNLCTTNNNEYRATPEQVNSEVWMTIINGGTGIEYFCDDTNLSGTSAYNFCLGSYLENTTFDNAAAAATASNLTYVNTNLLTYAPEILGTLNAICTMNTPLTSGVQQYSSYTTSCTNGILTMSTGTSTVPGSAMLRTHSGTLYLFADSDRNGSAAMTFTLTGYAGKIATVVYDSNAQYDPTHSSVGTQFTLNGSGQFSDTFGANGHNYQPKIYTITNFGNPGMALDKVAIQGMAIQ
jgi:hypothetical protein